MTIRNSDTVFAASAADYIERLVEARSFRSARDYAARQGGSLTGLTSPDAARFFLAAARAEQAIGTSDAALRALRIAQTHAETAGDQALLGDIYLTLGQTLRLTDQLSAAEKALRDAESIFRRADHRSGQARALNQLAGFYFRQGEYGNAVTNLLEAVEIVRDLGDTRQLGFMLGNLGRVYTLLGEPTKAEAYLRQNIELSTDLDDLLEVGRAQLSLGYLQLQCERFDDAALSLDAAERSLTIANSPRDMAILATYRGELEYKRGDFARSSETLRTALSMARAIDPHSTLTGRVHRHLAELAVRTGDFPTATREVSLGLTLMAAGKDAVETAALTLLRAMIANQENKREAAKADASTAVAMLEDASAAFEQMAARAWIGSTDLFSPKHRMLHLVKAEEFYTRHGLTLAAERTARILSGLYANLRKSAAATVAADSDVTVGAVAPEHDYVTTSEAINRFKQQLPALARPDLPLLLTGETGVGKDRLARYFAAVARPNKPFVSINCASIPETLLESELFGHTKGAFTGADGHKDGLFVAANGGVLFLDEIGDMPLQLQAKLLGVLEHKRLTPLGSTSEVELDILLVAATNQPLDKLVAQGKFRSDLYYRLSGLPFHLPALKDRKEDIPLLMTAFMRDAGLLEETELPPAELVRQFLAYDWPGNVRELKNRLTRLEVMSQLARDGDIAALASSLFDSERTTAGSASLFDRVAEFERQLIDEALIASGGNKSKAARLLGVHEATIRTKVKRYGMESRVN